MLIRSLLLLAALAGPVLGDGVGLVRVGENWRYFKGLGEPSVQTNAWTQLAFDDSVWPEGQSGFSNGLVGYGEATQLRDMFASYGSVYFRKNFAVADPKQVQWLILRVDYSAGFVAYLNGREIARRNLSGSPGVRVPYNASATGVHLRGRPEDIDASAIREALVPGRNVLAIQAHTAGPNDFDFGVLVELLANFTRGPFIQNASSNSVQIIWRTVEPADSLVEFGTNSVPDRTATISTPTTNHVITLTNLIPNQTYFYRVGSAGPGKAAFSPVESLHTLKAVGSLSFMVLGDSGSGSAAQYAIAQVLQNAKPDLVLHAGDIVYPAFSLALADTRCLSVYAAHMKTTPYFFAFGNHDLYDGDIAFLETFYLPTNSITGTEHFYSFDHGDAHFTVLFVPYLNQYQLKVGDNQHRWLVADLAATKKPWKFLLFHHPISTSGLHRFDDNNANGAHDRFDVMNVILPLAQQYGVQMVLAGHDHNYERFNPTNGVYAITSGGGGVGLYPLIELDTGSAQFWSRHNCVKVTVNGDELFLQAFNESGAVFDSMTIYRSVPAAAAYPSSWRSPAIESKPGDDQDGNITGQGFDFYGTPIPAASGQFSNLGRAYVNNDRTHLYVGIEQCMIYPNNNIFLFLESPRQSGVPALAGLGNGVVDPKGEGADGLDFLANLSFTNFLPSIGCIFGDEFGDAQDRRFGRPGLALNTGQGIFQLDSKLSDLSGARFQQFNRSPQDGGIANEQNANFIELAIPYQALGNLQPGDIIKIGAVVGGAGFDTNALRQSRQLDSSFLGRSLTGSGLGPVVLEGVPVQLAVDPDPDSDGLANADEARLGTNPLDADTDRDGLSDGWEATYGLNPLSELGDDGTVGDPDGDGATNGQEQIAGTNPRDFRSVLRVRLEWLGGQTNRISWPAVIGRKYQLQFSSDPFVGYRDVPNPGFPLSAAATNTVYLEELKPPIPPARFYRLRVSP